MIFSGFFFLGLDFDFQHCVVSDFSFSWVSYSAHWEECSECMVILGCLHQIPLCWRQQFRMSRFSDSLEIDDGGDERLKKD
jgi:hypothetical protein